MSKGEEVNKIGEKSKWQNNNPIICWMVVSILNRDRDYQWAVGLAGLSPLLSIICAGRQNVQVHVDSNFPTYFVAYNVTSRMLCCGTDCHWRKTHELQETIICAMVLPRTSPTTNCAGATICGSTPAFS